MIVDYDETPAHHAEAEAERVRPAVTELAPTVRGTGAVAPHEPERERTAEREVEHVDEDAAGDGAHRIAASRSAVSPVAARGVPISVAVRCAASVAVSGAVATATATACTAAHDRDARAHAGDGRNVRYGRGPSHQSLARMSFTEPKVAPTWGKYHGDPTRVATAADLPRPGPLPPAASLRARRAPRLLSGA